MMKILPGKTLLYSSIAALGLALPAALPAAKDSTVLEFARQLNEAFVQVAETVSPSVVVIRVKVKQFTQENQGEGNPYLESLPKVLREQLEEYLRQQKEDPRRGNRPEFSGQGSGVIIRKNGYILTNRHVVENAAEVKVRLRDGREYPATIRGLDAQSDLAVIKIEADDLSPARFTDSSKVRVGEFAIAIGAPFDLDYSVTFGHVSAKGRSQIIPDAEMDQDFIQTDANINPGNSGGPLVNIDGEIMGINTLIRGLRTGIGFAVPANLAREISDKLITDGKVVRAWLGIGMASLREDSNLRKQFKNVKEGLVVTGILEYAPASKSELKYRDVITAVAGRPVILGQQLRNEIRGKPLGKPVILTVNRAGKELTISITPEAWPESVEAFVAKNQSHQLESNLKELDFTVAPITRKRARDFKIEMTDGIVITKIGKDGLAARAGLQAGDIIKTARKTRITTVEEFNDILGESNLKRGLPLEFISKGEKQSKILKAD